MINYGIPLATKTILPFAKSNFIHATAHLNLDWTQSWTCIDVWRLTHRSASHTDHKSTDVMNRWTKRTTSSTIARLIWRQNTFAKGFRSCLFLYSSPCCESRWCGSCRAFLNGEPPSKITQKVSSVNVVLRPSQLQKCSTHWLKLSTDWPTVRMDE